MIPKVLHHTLIYSDNDPYPPQFEGMIASFQKHNPDFEIKLWHRKEVLALMTDHQRKLYESYKHDIQRADMARYIVLYYNGGYYSDLDVYTMQSWSKMAELYTASSTVNTSCILLEELYFWDSELDEFEKSELRQRYLPPERRRPPRTQLSNYWMAMTARHPVMDEILRLLEERHDIPINPDYFWDVIWTTGPGVVTTAFNNLQEQQQQEQGNTTTTSTTSSSTLRGKNNHDNIQILMHEDKDQQMSTSEHITTTTTTTSTAVIPKRIYEGHLTCGLAYWLHVQDYYPWCGYLYHHAAGLWKPDDWCSRSPIRCFIYNFGDSLIIGLTIIALYFRCVVAKRRMWIWKTLEVGGGACVNCGTNMMQSCSRHNPSKPHGT